MIFDYEKQRLQWNNNTPPPPPTIKRSNSERVLVVEID